jgi:hypothetical protein
VDVFADEFVGAVGARLAESFLLRDAGVQVVSTKLVGVPGSWPVRLEVAFLDPGGVAYVWDAGDYDYADVPGASDNGTADLDSIVDDWCTVAGANLAEWVAVRDRENWSSVRVADG